MSTVSDPFALARFVAAQEPVYDDVLRELGAGRKRTHWMWFVFPQERGLGRSETSRFYGIGSLDEARAYLAHATLGPRLVTCTELVLAVEHRTLHEIFGSPDDLKFCSSMRLFASANAQEDGIFTRSASRYCGDDVAAIDEARARRSRLAASGTSTTMP